jgi:hypothetical protein
MSTFAGQRRAAFIWFVSIASVVYVAAIQVASWLPKAEPYGSLVAGALVFDLVVLVPLVYYALVVRRSRLPAVSLVPVFLLSVLVASRILPADQPLALRILELMALPVEIAILGCIGWRASRAISDAPRDSTTDPIEHMRRVAFELTKNDRVAAIVATEVAVFVYAFGSWRSRPHAPAGMKAFSHHSRSGHGGIVLGFGLVMAFETVAVHLLLLQWSAIVAWLLTIGTIYGALWLVGDYRATVLRPILVDDQRVVIRAGFRCRLEVPLDRVFAVSREKPDFGKESVNLTFLGTPTRWLILAKPTEADGPYGFKLRVRAIGIVPDDAAAFDNALAGASYI